MKRMVILFGGAILCYIVIVLLIAVIPAIDLSRTPAGPGVVPMTALEAEGREVFAANGCDYCHTQQVRPLPEDKPFGRPSAPGDFAYQTPELLGSERTGPDLTNVGNRRGEVWQYMHLWDPRSVSPKSIMPDFKYLFRVVKTVPAGETAVPVPAAFAPRNGDKVVPTQRGKALVAYLMSLKQTRIPGYEMHNTMGGPTSAAPTAAPPSAAPAAGGYAYDAAKGKALFDGTCAACHQASGEGVPGAFPPLKGIASTNAADPSVQLETILHGRHGTVIGGKKYSGVMPPFASQFSDVQIADIANYERSSWGNHGKPVSPLEVATIRAGKKLGASSSAATSSPAAGPAPTASAVPSSAAAGGYAYDAVKGKASFDATCAACHQATGEGIPGAFPPLKGNPAVAAANPALHIETVLNGAHGRTIDGVHYSGAMPPFGGQLSDVEVADIINYERSSWGNHARHVTPAEVAAVRAKDKQARLQP